jgi:saccharopine dehydrogenase (NAD+, L-lysine-forming)
MSIELANAHPKPWALYGATGVTGRLILGRALARGHRPALIGRDPARLAALAAPHGLETVVANLTDAPALAAALAGRALVLNAAGPFRLTGGPVLRAALAAGADYLDVSGELNSLLELVELDAEARGRGVVLVGGAGFGVTASDGLALKLSQALGGATRLRLSIMAGSAFNSPAVGESVVDGVGGGGREIEGGQLVRRNLARRRWRESLPDGGHVAFASAPLAELAAARRATGAADILAGLPMPTGQALAVSVIAPLLPALLTLPPVRRAMSGAGGHTAGKSVKTEHRSRVWVEAERDGRVLRGRLDAGEGFAAAADIAVHAIETMLSARPAPGAYTPATAFGPDFIAGVAGVTLSVDGPCQRTVGG